MAVATKDYRLSDLTEQNSTGGLKSASNVMLGRLSLTAPEATPPSPLPASGAGPPSSACGCATPFVPPSSPWVSLPGLPSLSFVQNSFNSFNLNIFVTLFLIKGLPWWLRGYSVCLHCRRPGFDPCVGKIPWRRKWQPTPVLLPGESHGWRSLVGYSLWDRKDSDMTEQLHFREV